MSCVVSVFALVWFILRRSVENAAVRLSRVLVSIVPACPMGVATNSTLPPISLEGRVDGGVLIGLLRVFLVASEVSGEHNLYEDEGA